MYSKQSLQEWDWLFNTLWNASSDVEFLKRVSIASVKTEEARRLVWGYHDLHCDNVIVEEEDRVDLGDDDDDDDDDDDAKGAIGGKKDEESAEEKMRRRMKKLYDRGPKSVQFGQADYSGPAFAAFDLASILVSFEDVRLRQEKTGKWLLEVDTKQEGGISGYLNDNWQVDQYLSLYQTDKIQKN